MSNIIKMAKYIHIKHGELLKSSVNFAMIHFFVIVQVHFEKILQIEFGKITNSIR